MNTSTQHQRHPLLGWIPGNLLHVMLKTVGTGLAAHEGNHLAAKTFEASLRRAKENLDLTREGQDILRGFVETWSNPPERPGRFSLAAWLAHDTWIRLVPSEVHESKVAQDISSAFEEALSGNSCPECVAPKAILLRFVTQKHIEDAPKPYWRVEQVLLCPACLRVTRVGQPRIGTDPIFPS